MAEVQDVDEALKRLPVEVIDARNQRLKRAHDVSLKKHYLPKELQGQADPLPPLHPGTTRSAMALFISSICQEGAVTMLYRLCRLLSRCCPLQAIADILAPTASAGSKSLLHWMVCYTCIV